MAAFGRPHHLNTPAHQLRFRFCQIREAAVASLLTFFVAHDSLSAHAVSRASSVFNSSSSSSSTGRASSLRKLGSS